MMLLCNNNFFGKNLDSHIFTSINEAYIRSFESEMMDYLFNFSQNVYTMKFIEEKLEIADLIINY